MGIVFRLTNKLWWNSENFSNETTCESGYNGCFVHFLVLFLVAIGKLRFELGC